MRARRGFPRLLATTAAFALLAAACGGDGDGAAGGDERRVLRVGGFAADIGLLDPHFAAAGMDRQIMKPMFEGLVRFVPGNVTAGFQPAIATEVPETPEPNPDGTQVWEFDIREGVMCHEGPNNPQYELTVEDVVLSYQKASNPETSAYASNYNVFESIEAVDDNTVAFTLSSPRSAELFLPYVADFAGGYVVCSQAVNPDNVEEFQTHPVGTGPFQFVEYNSGRNLVLEANDDYWRGPPRLGGIEMLFMADDNSRTLALQAGDVDLIYGVTETQWVERIDAIDGITAIAIPIGGLQTFSINKSIEPFDDIRVRQAIAYAHSREDNIAVSGPAIKQPACSIAPFPNHPGALTCEEVEQLGFDYAVSQDLDRARQLLEEAGVGDGFSFTVTSSELEIYRNHYQIMQANLAQIGVDMQIDVVAHPTMHSTIRANQNAIVQYLAPRPTMAAHMLQFVHSDAIVTKPTGITNFSHFAGADDLIEEALNETDSERQNELWKEVNARVLEDVAIISNSHDTNPFAYVDEFDPGHEPVATLESSFVLNEDSGFTTDGS